MARRTVLWLPACAAGGLLLLEASAGGWVTPQPTEGGVHAAREPFEFRDGVIVDPDRPAIYLMTPQGRVDGVDPAAGQVIWSTRRAAKPLLLTRDLLVGQAEIPDPGILRVVVLSTRATGTPVLEINLDLPAGVRASIDDALGASFRASARLHADDLVISWRFSRQPIRGAAPDPDVPSQAAQITGAFRVDLKTGHVQRLEADELPPPLAPHLPADVARLVASGALTGPLWYAGGVVATIERTSDASGQQTILRRWRADSGEPLPDVVLFRRGLSFRYASADHRHLLASRLIDARGPVWAWSIYSVTTGALATAVRAPVPAARFFVWDPVLIHESPATERPADSARVQEPPKLRGLALQTGAELWEQPIRDTAYRGPYPAVPRGPSEAPGSPAP